MSDSSSRRNAGSAAEIWSRYAGRCSGARFRIASSLSLISCQRSISFDRSGAIASLVSTGKSPSFFSQFAMKPGPCSRPLPFYGCWRDTHDRRSFLDRKPSEKSKFNYPSLLGIQPPELVERFVQSEQVKITFSGEQCSRFAQGQIVS